MTVTFPPNLESIVRPFALKNILPAPTPLPGPVVPGCNAIGQSPDNPSVVKVSLGGSGGRTTTFTLEGGGFIVEESNNFKESSRKSTKVRVENEDDPAQFVEFCRADKIKLTPKKTGAPPARTSTYDTSGGYHDHTGNQNPSARRDQQYEFKYPSDTTCKSAGDPDRGCG